MQSNSIFQKPIYKVELTLLTINRDYYKYVGVTETENNLIIIDNQQVSIVLPNETKSIPDRETFLRTTKKGVTFIINDDHKLTISIECSANLTIMHQRDQEFRGVLAMLNKNNLPTQDLQRVITEYENFLVANKMSLPNSPRHASYDTFRPGGGTSY